MAATRDEHISLLQGYFDTDGSCRRSRVEVTTASVTLAKQLQQILLSLGIVARRAPRWNEEQQHNYWRLTISGEHLRVFENVVGFRYERDKARALRRACQLSCRPNLGYPHVDKLVSDIRAERQKMLPADRPRLAIRLGAFCSKTRLPSRGVIRRIAGVHGGVPAADKLRALIDFYPDEVVSVHKLKRRRRVYDLNVPGTHTFFANGVVSHNTTAMCRRIAYLVKVRKVDPRSILATTFTRKAAAHMNRKLAELKVHRARVGTLHSVAYEILRRDGGKYQGRFKLKDKMPLPPRAVIEGRWQATQDEIRSFVGWCKNFLLTPRASETAPPIVDYLQRNYDSDRDDRGVRHATRLLYAYGCYERRRIKRKLLTYDDILCQCHQLLQEQPRILAKWRARYRYIIIDEVQDTCLAQHEIIRLLAAPRNNLVVVGDVDQCHPAGVKVAVAPGKYRRIEELKDGDTVGGWSRHAQKMVFGRRVQVGCRDYHGRLYTVRTAGHSVPMTSNHRVLARWTNRNTDACVTYLMWRRDLGFRVGWCQLFKADGALHLSHRARIEGAEKVWLLKVHASRTEASTYESVAAAKYGLPTITFEPVADTKHLTEAVIGEVFAQLADENHERGVRALHDHGREFEQPLYPWIGTTRETVARQGRMTYFEVFAPNVQPEIMSLPLPGGRNRWAPVQRNAVSEYHGPVYSLDVEKDHSYAANGVVVLNSIYGFRGALPQFMLDFPKRYHAPVVYMNSNYRSVPAVCTAAAKLIAHNQQRLPTTMVATRPALGTAAVTVTYVLNGDDEGRHVAHMLQRWHQRYAWKDLAVLCRTNYQCQSLEAELLYAHIPYRLVSGTVLLGRKVVAALLEYLKLGQSLHWGHIDFDAVIETINLPKRGVGPAFVRQLEEATSHKQQDPEAAILKLAKPKQRVSLDTYLDLAHRIAASIRKHQRPAEILAWVADELELIKIYNDAKRRRRAITAIDMLLLLAQQFRSTKRFLRWVDDTMMDNPDADADDLEDDMNPPDKVVVSTIHRAKGLEFNAVALPFWNEAQMPHNMGSVEEERRLAYVAVTRAKDCAAVSCVHPLGTESGADAGGPSRFLAEMGLADTPV
jgi:DNA helicase-2/ATP-dependent DNA helicase PcrA